MLHRKESEGLIVISQPAHAWISGQLARHWGRGEFFPVPEEVCLAAELHDVGFLHWEQLPALDPATGLPYSFMELPTEMHLDIWTTGIRNMLRFGRYPALLVSMHFSHIARTQWSEERKSSKPVQDYLQAQEELQTALLTSLSNDFAYGAWVNEQTARQHQLLLSTWDWMSLIICLRLYEEREIPGIPSREGASTIKLTRLDMAATRYAVSPWPFRPDSLRLVCEGRHLLETFKDESQMREHLRAAAPMTLVFELVPG